MRNERSLRIMTAEGSLLGSVEEGIFVFKGIPYAAPPVGELRWKAPKPLNAWQGDKDATDWGPASWQSREYCLAVGGGDPGRFHEDCLYLNVWTPDIAPATPLPVMVWIHGGGYAVGSGGLTPYLGEPLAQRGAVIVTINYRLGQLGFLLTRRWTANMPTVKWSITSPYSIRLPPCSGCSAISVPLVETRKTSR